MRGDVPSEENGPPAPTVGGEGGTRQGRRRARSLGLEELTLMINLPGNPLHAMQTLACATKEGESDQK